MQERYIRVVIVDDHPFVRLGLSTVFEVFDDLKLVGEAQNGEEAIALVEQLQPDVVLMDLLMPVMDGITAIQIICQKYPSVRIVVLTSMVDDELIQKAQKAGATSYMFKAVTIDTLAATIRAVAR